MNPGPTAADPQGSEEGGRSGELAGARLRGWRWVMVAVAVLGYGLDQLTKWLAVTHLDPADPPSYLGGLLELRLLHNPGAAFSMGSGATVVITVFAAVALLFTLVCVAPRARHRWSLLACGMVLAGTAGNLTDRLVRPPAPLRGHVVDFFALPHFAVFNVADIFITGTAVLVVVMTLVGQPDRSASHQDRPGPGEEATR